MEILIGFPELLAKAVFGSAVLGKPAKLKKTAQPQNAAGGMYETALTYLESPAARLLRIAAALGLLCCSYWVAVASIAFRITAVAPASPRFR